MGDTSQQLRGLRGQQRGAGAATDSTVAHRQVTLSHSSYHFCPVNFKCVQFFTSRKASHFLTKQKFDVALCCLDAARAAHLAETDGEGGPRYTAILTSQASRWARLCCILPSLQASCLLRLGDFGSAKLFAEKVLAGRVLDLIWNQVRIILYSNRCFLQRGGALRGGPAGKGGGAVQPVRVRAQPCGLLPRPPPRSRQGELQQWDGQV